MNNNILVNIWSASEWEENIKNNPNILRASAVDYLDKYLPNAYKLCEKYDPKNVNTWKVFYFTSEDGQNQDDLKVAALEYYKKVKHDGINITYNDCFNILYNRAIYQVFDEYKFNKKINKDLSRYNIKIWNHSDRVKVANTDKRFKNTNDVFNSGKFNHMRKIGYCMQIIRECKPNKILSWQRYYNDSGFELKKIDMKNNKNAKEIFLKHGRTVRDLVKLADKFKDELNKNTSSDRPYTLEECFNYLYIRVVDKTFIGYLREVFACEFLNEFCEKNGLNLKETDMEKDVGNCVDYEIYKNDKLILGLQVKGIKYKQAVDNNNLVAISANRILTDGQDKYTTENGVPVLQLYVNNAFFVKNKNILINVINREVKKTTKNYNNER